MGTPKLTYLMSCVLFLTLLLLAGCSSSKRMSAYSNRIQSLIPSMTEKEVAWSRIAEYSFRESELYEELHKAALASDHGYLALVAYIPSSYSGDDFSLRPGKVTQGFLDDFYFSAIGAFASNNTLILISSKQLPISGGHYDPNENIMMSRDYIWDDYPGYYVFNVDLTTPMITSVSTSKLLKEFEQSFHPRSINRGTPTIGGTRVLLVARFQSDKLVEVGISYLGQDLGVKKTLPTKPIVREGHLLNLLVEAVMLSNAHYEDGKFVSDVIQVIEGKPRHQENE